MEGQILTIEGLVGKKIYKCVYSCGDLYIRFLDNTFSVLTIRDTTEGFGYEQQEVKVDDYGTNKSDFALVELGLVTKSEYEESCKNDEMDRETDRLQRQKEDEEFIKEIELKKLKELKSKYES